MMSEYQENYIIYTNEARLYIYNIIDNVSTGSGSVFVCREIQ